MHIKCFLKNLNGRGNVLLKVKFLENVNISDKVSVFKGETFEAEEGGDFIMIRMEDDSTVKAPKSEIEDILKVIK